MTKGGNEKYEQITKGGNKKYERITKGGNKKYEKFKKGGNKKYEQIKKGGNKMYEQFTKEGNNSFLNHQDILLYNLLSETFYSITLFFRIIYQKGNILFKLDAIANLLLYQFHELSKRSVMHQLCGAISLSFLKSCLVYLHLQTSLLALFHHHYASFQRSLNV